MIGFEPGNQIIYHAIWYNLWQALATIGGYLSLFSTIYLFIYSYFRDQSVSKSMEDHLIAMRPDIFGEIPRKRVIEIVQYRFSHIGLSDLFDHIKDIRRMLSGDTQQNEGGDIESYAQVGDQKQIAILHENAADKTEASELEHTSETI